MSLNALCLCAIAHAGVRVVQWYLVLSFLFAHWEALKETIGSAIWLLPIALVGWAKMEFTDVHILFLFPNKLRQKRKGAVAI